jgi:large subunit ribosomal protein L31
MNSTIHPHYERTTAHCVTCGAEYDTRSTRGELRVDVCASCHPFYTGAAARPLSGSRIARFEARRRLALDA